MNRCKLKIPNFIQYVSCTTRKDASLDEFLCNVKDAHRSVQQPPLKNSDHNMINMQPIYRRKLSKSKPNEKEITCMTEESLETLNTSFDATDWDIFVNRRGAGWYSVQPWSMHSNIGWS